MEAPLPFDVVFVEREAPPDPHVPLVIWWATRLAELGFTPRAAEGTGEHGNLSCRTPGGFLISAHGSVKSTLAAEDLVEVLGVETAGGARVRCRGTAAPSSDALLHWRIYQARPEIQAILHGHDPDTLARAHELHIPITPRSDDGRAAAELLEEVCQLAARYDYLLVRGHGFLALGKSLDEAGELVRALSARARSLGR